MTTLYLQVVRDMRLTLDNIEAEVRTDERIDLLYFAKELASQAERFKRAIESAQHK